MKKILVIDDAEFILESTSTLLSFEGYEVFTAEDGKTGIEIAKKELPDLILCDISMPGYDGYQVLEEIRLIPGTQSTPFIFLTAFSEKANMRAGMEKGADDYIVKPYTRNELIAAINAQWLKKSTIEGEVREKVAEVGRNVTYALPHEFRTALNEVIGSAKYLRTSADVIEPDEIAELSGDIITSAQRLLKITENFLVYVSVENIEANPQKRAELLKGRTHEPAATISDFAAVVAHRYDRYDDLQVGDFIEGISLHISTENFHKVFDELLDNAFRFSEKGTPIKLTCSKEDDKICFRIVDHGRGMTQDQINSIAALAQFQRMEYEQQGIGLGLVLAKKIVELHDGIFDIQSVEGEGTQVYVHLKYEKY